MAGERTPSRDAPLPLGKEEAAARGAARTLRQTPPASPATP